MALKKSQLYSSLWQSCDELRGGMDASQYKDYILTLLFMKYVSDIRKNLITRGLIKGIIGLPANLFYGTGIPACIVVIDKEHAHARTGIFMIDASKGFQKDGNKNRLRSQDIHKIVDVFNNQIEVPRYSRMVPVTEIAAPANDYNLNIPRYIDSSEPEDLHDLEAHLLGGIPNRDIDELQEYWDVFPSLRKALFKKGDRFGYSDARVDAQQVKPLILAHAEFASYQQRVSVIFDEWRAAHSERLNRLKIDDKGKVTKGGVNDRLKALKDEPDSDEEEASLNHCLELMDAESEAKKAVKEVQEKLDAAVLKKYGDLSEADIKALAVDHKWFASIESAIEGEVNRITQRLAERVTELDDRYSRTMPDLELQTEALNSNVACHLKQMGLVWA